MMPDTRVDVVDVIVAGGGPAGLATAITLARRGRSVAVVERTRYDRLRAGETLGGEVRHLLAALGVRERIESLGSAPLVGIASAWGSDDLSTRSAVFHPLGEGLHVNRAEFDATLARAAKESGVSIISGVGRCAIGGEAGAWTISGAGFSLTARWLVDASGRGAPATRSLFPHRRWLAHDRLIGITARLSPRGDSGHDFVLEALPDGWGYAAPQHDGSLLLTVMTDRDLPRASDRATLAAWWQNAVTQSTHLSRLAEIGEWAGELSLFGAESGMLSPDRGDGWRAVGDAAMACDPLGGNGVARALAAGIQAGEEIDRVLHGDAFEASDTTTRFARYLDRKDSYYRREGRWPESRFWARRHPADWKASPILVGPTDVLKMSDRPAPASVAAAEALVSYGAVETLLGRLPAGLPAHEAMTLLRNECPYLPDGRLLCALHMLCHNPSGKVPAR